MKYRIDDIKTVENTSLLYVVVSFLDDTGKIVLHRNDFIMQIAATQHWYTHWIDDTTPDPISYEEYDTDVKTVILSNVKSYIERLETRTDVPDDLRNSNIKSEDTDPLGLRTKPGVAQLIGVVQDSEVSV